MQTLLENAISRLQAKWVIALLVWLTSAAAWAYPDYAVLDDLLVNYVVDGVVDYDGFAADARLGTVLQELADTDTSDLTSDAALKAFYINAYNLLAIDGVLNGESAANRRQRRQFFVKRTREVMGEPLSMQAIEHNLLRPMGDPRIHFAIVCASLSCPRLANRAYRPETLDEQLDAAAREFINDPTRNRFDPRRGRGFVSRLFDWFGADFAGEAGSVQRYISAFVLDPDTERELRRGALEIRFEDYDWSLNGHYARAK